MRRRTSLGFTLIELVVVVAIVAILAVLAIPSFKEMLKQNRSVSFVNELVSALNLARSEAVKRGLPVTVCVFDPATDVTTALAAGTLACSTTMSWNNGWLIFVDNYPKGGTAGTFDSANDTVLKVGQPTHLDLTVTATTNYTDYITYLPSGAAKRGSPSQTNQTLETCVGAVGGQSVGVPRTITINITGRLSVTKATAAGAATC